nr:MAG TPA: hypothetical protein [Caudoviricetes sp.]
MEHKNFLSRANCEVRTACLFGMECLSLHHPIRNRCCIRNPLPLSGDRGFSIEIAEVLQ